MSGAFKNSSRRQSLVRRLSEAQNHRCAYCGIAMRFSWEPRARFLGGMNVATIDHVVPWGLGGPNDWENLIAACKLCNNARGTENAWTFFWRRGWEGRQARMEAQIPRVFRGVPWPKLAQVWPRGFAAVE